MAERLNKTEKKVLEREYYSVLYHNIRVFLSLFDDLKLKILKF